MRILNDTILSGSDATSQTGIQVDTNQLIDMSFHIILSDSTGAGTLTIQASNDVIQVGPAQTPAVNWVNIPSATVTLAAGTKQGLVALTNVAYRFVRAVYTSTTAGTGTVTVNMFAQGQ